MPERWLALAEPFTTTPALLWSGNLDKPLGQPDSKDIRQVRPDTAQLSKSAACYRGRRGGDGSGRLSHFAKLLRPAVFVVTVTTV